MDWFKALILILCYFIGALASLLIVYSLGCFVTWDLDWPEELSNWSELHRAFLILFTLFLASVLGWKANKV